MDRVSVAQAELNFIGGQSGPPLFPANTNLAPLPSRNQNFFGWQDLDTSLCFAIFPARAQDDGFDGMHFQIYTEEGGNRRRLAWLELREVSGSSGLSDSVTYTVSYPEFVKAKKSAGAELEGKISILVSKFGSEEATFEYFLKMAKACHTHLFRIREDSSGSSIFDVSNEFGDIKFIVKPDGETE